MMMVAVPKQASVGQLRAIAIATGKDYKEVYDLINRHAANERRRTVKKSNARTGVHMVTMQSVMQEIGWTWTPTMQVGQLSTTHLRRDELPSGRIITRLSRHYAAVIDGVLHDNHDSCREGDRLVYGYWTNGSNKSR